MTGLTAEALFRFRVFALQARHEFGDRLRRLDRADALAAAPDVAPGLGFDAPREAKFIVVGSPCRQVVGIEPRVDDRGLADNCRRSPVKRLDADDVGRVAVDDRLLIGVNRARFLRWR